MAGEVPPSRSVESTCLVRIDVEIDGAATLHEAVDDGLGEVGVAEARRPGLEPLFEAVDGDASTWCTRSWEMAASWTDGAVHGQGVVGTLARIR